MIAKYKQCYFNIDLTVTPAQIWAYRPVDGFEKKTTRRGTVYYEAVLPVSELEKIFDPVFSVKWNGVWFGCQYLPKSRKIRLFTPNADLIEKYGFSEFEHGAWNLYVDIDTCEDFQLKLKDYFTNELLEVNPSKSEWEDYWNKMVAELIPQR